jgi:hypothetical protein
VPSLYPKKTPTPKEYQNQNNYLALINSRLLKTLKYTKDEKAI